MNKLEVAFLGDIALNGKYIDLYKKKEEPFFKVGQYLKDCVVVGNFEGFVSGDQGVNVKKKPRLEINENSINYVRDFHLEYACLANNHVYDHLDSGFSTTLEALNRNKVRTLGASLNERKNYHIDYIKKNGITIALLNYVSADTNPNSPENTGIRVSYFQEEDVIEDVKRISSKVDHIVLSLHWGGRVEGGRYPDWEQPNTARRLIDAGVDLIIGHHSHTIQPLEVYKGKYIFYSLGNFCFSDFIFEDKQYVLSKLSKTGLVIKVLFSKKKYNVQYSVWENKNLYLCPNDQTLKFFNWFYIRFIKLKIVWVFYFVFLKKVKPVCRFIQRSDMTFYQKIKSVNLHKVIKIFARKLF